MGWGKKGRRQRRSPGCGFTYHPRQVGEIPPRGLYRCPRVHHSRQLLRREANGWHAVKNTDDGRDTAILSDYSLELEIFAEGSMGVDGGFKGHHRLVGSNSIRDLVRDM